MKTYPLPVTSSELFYLEKFIRYDMQCIHENKLTSLYKQITTFFSRHAYDFEHTYGIAAVLRVTQQEGVSLQNVLARCYETMRFNHDMGRFSMVMSKNLLVFIAIVKEIEA